MKKKGIVLLLSAFIISAVIVFLFSDDNPYQDVEWIKDYPGSTDKFATFTPVLKADKNIILGPTVGADYAEIRFEDLNMDGVKEAIIETTTLIDFGETYTPEKHILKSYVDTKGLTRFEVFEP